MSNVFIRWVIPRKDILVRDPRTKAPLPKQGMNKPWTGPEGRYWRRRLICGDISLGKEIPITKSKTEKVEKEKSKRRK